MLNEVPLTDVGDCDISDLIKQADDHVMNMEFFQGSLRDCCPVKMLFPYIEHL